MDEPLFGTLNALVRKVPAAGYATTRPTAGAQLTVNYYDNPEPETNPKQTWVIQTLPDGNGNYTAKLDQAHLVSGSLTYGEIVLPLGCITIQETKAPEGYQINNTVWKLQILQSGNGVIYSSTTQPEIQNVPVDPEELGEIPTFELTNTQVFMSKTDMTGEKEVEGAQMTVNMKWLKMFLSQLLTTDRSSM